MSKVFLVLHLVNNMVLKTSAADARQCVEPVENSAEWDQSRNRWNIVYDDYGASIRY